MQIGNSWTLNPNDKTFFVEIIFLLFADPSEHIHTLLGDFFIIVTSHLFLNNGN